MALPIRSLEKSVMIEIIEGVMDAIISANAKHILNV
jgi:hypothetical protein